MKPGDKVAFKSKMLGVTHGTVVSISKLSEPPKITINSGALTLIKPQDEVIDCNCNREPNACFKHFYPKYEK